MRSAIVVSLLITISTQQITTTTTTPASTTTTNTTTTATGASGGSSDSTPTTISTSTKTTTTQATTKTTTAKPSVGKLRPVSDACLALYLNCTSNNPLYLSANFCQSFKDEVTCFNATTSCTADDINRLKYVDCGPNQLGTEVGTTCMGRITECLSLYSKQENINTSTDFKLFFCANRNETCLTTLNNKAICTATEYKAAQKAAKCTAAQTMVSSALLTCVVILTQRILSSY